MVLRGGVTLALVDQHFPARFHAWGLRRGLGESLHAGPRVARRPATCAADSRVYFSSAITLLQAPGLCKPGRVRGWWARWRARLGFVSMAWTRPTPCGFERADLRGEDVP